MYNINGKILPSEIDYNRKYRIIHEYGLVNSLNGKFTLERKGTKRVFYPKDIVFYYGEIEVDFGSYPFLATDIIYYSFGAFEYTADSLYKTSDFSGSVFISKTTDFSGSVLITGGIHPPKVIVTSDNVVFDVFSTEQNPHLMWERPEEDISPIVGYYYAFNQDATHIVYTTDTFYNFNEITIPVSKSGVWYFHIRAINSFGNLSKQTTTVCIKYNHIPSIPVGLLTNDSPNYVGALSMESFYWDESIDSDSDIFKYSFELYKTFNDDRSDSLIYSKDLYENFLTYPEDIRKFFNPGNYYYKVRAFDAYQTSEWSDNCYFTIVSIKEDAFRGSLYAAHMPPIPTITCNVGNNVWTSQNIINFSWSSENDRVGIDRYIYEFVLARKFIDEPEYTGDKIVIYDSDSSLVTTSRYNLDLFNGSSIYKLLVRAVGTSGLITEPGVYYIRYNHPLTTPYTPMLVNNIDSILNTGFVGSNFNNIFKWLRSEDADDDIIYYEIQVSKDLSFSDLFYEKINITDDPREKVIILEGILQYGTNEKYHFTSYEDAKAWKNWQGPYIRKNIDINSGDSNYYSIVRKSGFLKVEEEGWYVFRVRIDDHAAFRVDHKTYYGSLGGYRECFNIYLTTGYHYIENYVDNTGGAGWYSEIQWKKEGYSDDYYEKIPDNLFFYACDRDGNPIDVEDFSDLDFKDDSDSLSYSYSDTRGENYEFLMNLDYDSSYEGLYYWRVRAYDRKEYSSWSPTGKYKLNTPPSVPTNIIVTY